MPSSRSFAAVAASAAVLVSAGPCDIYGTSGTPCVAAYSTTRALYAAFNGALYQVTRASDNTTLDITVLAPGGFANAAAQDTFCAGTGCVIQRLYDQSPMANHMDIAPGGGAVPRGDLPVNATRHPITISGHAVYGAYFEGSMGYRIDNTTGVATGNDPETMYMVTSGTYYNQRCCFDFGNAEVDNHDDGPGTMEAVYFGSDSRTGNGAGAGPWVMADLENGLWPADTHVSIDNTPLTSEYVTAMLKGGTKGFALKGGDATQGPLQIMYDGPRPNGYQPMAKQGAIVLGIGGDNSDLSIGLFYEGVMTSGFSSDAADDAVQADIVAAGYGQ